MALRWTMIVSIIKFPLKRMKKIDLWMTLFCFKKLIISIHWKNIYIYVYLTIRCRAVVLVLVRTSPSTCPTTLWTDGRTDAVKNVRGSNAGPLGSTKHTRPFTAPFLTSTTQTYSHKVQVEGSSGCVSNILTLRAPYSTKELLSSIVARLPSSQRNQADCKTFKLETIMEPLRY